MAKQPVDYDPGRNVAYLVDLDRVRRFYGRYSPLRADKTWWGNVPPDRLAEVTDGRIRTTAMEMCVDRELSAADEELVERVARERHRAWLWQQLVGEEG